MGSKHVSYSMLVAACWDLPLSMVSLTRQATSLAKNTVMQHGKVLYCRAAAVAQALQKLEGRHLHAKHCFKVPGMA